MKAHYCPEERTTISYEGECNWCGEKEHATMSPKQIQELAGHTVSAWVIKLVQDAVEATKEKAAKVCEELVLTQVCDTKSVCAAAIRSMK